jgi:hypothetical protein
MKLLIFYCFALLMTCTGCKKTTVEIITETTRNLPTTDKYGFTQYTIKEGQHTADLSIYKPVAVSEMNFIVRFDSSAIYTTLAKENQYDINKLYGFADNASSHHQFSARIGWRWSDNALRLFAYVYNDAAVVSKELGIISIGEEIICNIKIEGSQYLFTANEYSQKLPRASKTYVGQGYQLYPYFGGDEPAPHDVRIWIKSI